MSISRGFSSSAPALIFFKFILHEYIENIGQIIYKQQKLQKTQLRSYFTVARVFLAQREENIGDRPQL